MKKKLANINIYIGFLLLVQLALMIYTWHDMSVSQGVGLYISLQVGAESKFVFDLLTDIVGVICFLIAIALPFLLLPYRKPESVLRFTSVYLAFMPVLRPAMLVHLFDGHSLLAVKFDTAMNVNLLFGFVREVFPLIFILAVLCRWKGFAVPKWHLGILVAELVLCLGMAFLPEVSEVCVFLMYYLLAILAFDQWERLWKEETSLQGKIVVWLLFGYLYLRGCERMLVLMANSHI